MVNVSIPHELPALPTVHYNTIKQQFWTLACEARLLAAIGQIPTARKDDPTAPLSTSTSTATNKPYYVVFALIIYIGRSSYDAPI
jgi:hypothetical protein